MDATQVFRLLDIAACILVLIAKVRFLWAYKGVIVPARVDETTGRLIPAPNITLGYHYAVSAIIFFTLADLVYSLVLDKELDPFSVLLLPALVAQAVYLNKFPRTMKSGAPDGTGRDKPFRNRRRRTFHDPM